MGCQSGRKSKMLNMTDLFTTPIINSSPLHFILELLTLDEVVKVVIQITIAALCISDLL